MATKIIHKKSSVAASVPSAADLAPGELALNLADQKIYSKTTGGTIIEMAPQGGGSTSTITETCKNVSGGSLAVGTPVYASGTAGNAIEVQAARADTAGAMPAIGILGSTLADEAEGTLVLTGFIQNVNTSIFSEGDTLYVAPTGGLTTTPPTGSGNLIQNIGKVVKVHLNNGSIMVTGAGRANATPNLDDGDIFIGNASNQATTASLTTEVQTIGDSRYVNTAGDTMTGDLDVQGTITSDGLTVDSGAVGLIGTFIGSTDSRPLVLNNYDAGFPGSGYALDATSSGGEIKLQTTSTDRLKVDSNGDISFYDDSENAKFFWDASAERLGIGTSSPDQILHVEKSVAGGGVELLVGNSGANQSGTYSQIGLGTGGDATGTAYFRLYRDGSGISELNGYTTQTFLTNGTERMRIDSSGNVIVGGTSAQASDAATLMADGEVTAAGFYFSNNIGAAMNDTGIRRATTSTMVFDTASTERMRIDSLGRVGIGTSSPATSISGSAQGLAIQHSNVPFLSLEHTGASGKRYTLYSNSAGALVTYDEDASTERMRIDSSGRVGIGTSLPAKTLHVNSGSVNEVARFESTDGTAYLSIMDHNTSSSLQGIGSAGDSLTFYANSGEHMRIDSSGNVGIGVSPATPLHVQNAASTSEVIRIGSSTVTHDTGLYLRTTGTAKISWGSGGALAFYGEGAGTSERMRIDSSGNLLVGKTSDNQALAGVKLGTGGSNMSRNNEVLVLNRLSTDGTILNLKKDGTSVGSIGNSGTALLFENPNANSYIAFHANNQSSGIFYQDGTTKNLAPYTARTGEFDLGNSGGRFKDLYLSGTVNANSVDLGSFVVTETNGHLYFSVGGVNKMKLDSSGNLQVVGNVDSNATIT